MTLDASDAGPFPALLAFVLVLAVGYVAVRSLLAHRRGDDVGRAAASGMRAVGPPLFLAVVGLVLLSILAVLTTVLLFVLLFVLVVGEDSTAGGLVVAWLIGGAVLVLTVVGAVIWGLVRVVRAARR